MVRFGQVNGQRKRSLASGSAHPSEVGQRRLTCHRGNLEIAQRAAMLPNQDRTVGGCRAIELAVSASLDSRKFHVSTPGNASASCRPEA